MFWLCNDDWRYHRIQIDGAFGQAKAKQASRLAQPQNSVGWCCWNSDDLDLSLRWVSTIKGYISYKMGCESSQISQSNRVVPLPIEATNSFLDKFPVIVLQKIKQKFDSLCEKETKDLMVFNFIRLYSRAKLSQDFLKRLITFFYDNQNNSIKFRHFIVKYATLTKCEPTIFFRILFEIYKNTMESEHMGPEQFDNFLRNQSKYFEKMPLHPQFPMNLQKFVEILTATGFNAKNYQARLSITTEEDIPFKTINQELFQCELHDFVVGGEYYLLSNAWYYRWSFYYLDVEQEQYKSTKFLQEENQVRRHKRREPQRRLARGNQMQSALIEQPRIIDFEDVEGQYRGQLKDNINIASQIKVITENIWILLCSLHPAEQQFKRPAINANKLEYFPKSVYFLEVDDSGRIVIGTQHIKHLSLSTKVAVFRKIVDLPRMGIFTKNFGEKNWRQVDERKCLAEVSLDPRFFIAVAYNRERFIQRMFRKEVLRENFQPGDQVFTYFPFIKAHCEASIISVCQSNTFKVHFKGFSYKYELKVSRDDLSMIQAEAAETSSKRRHQSLIKGIPNIGNTCFMNSVIQCLVATPILDNFLVQFSFDRKLHPIGYALSKIAKSLLKNEKPEPQEFKEIIDTQMPSFSGFHQQDAQEFLNLLLDKINEQLKEKPTVIDYLFGGKIQSRLTCKKCSNIKHIQQKMYILSLPIPQAQFYHYSIIIIHVSSRAMRKIIFKLHKNAVIGDYFNAFEERSGEDKRNFIFAETSYNSLKKVMSQLQSPEYQRKKITDTGITPSDSLLAFEKLPVKFYYDLLSSKPDNPYRDYQPTPSAGWTICKIMSVKIEKNMIPLEYLTQYNDIERVRVDKDTTQFAKLGSMTQLFHTKIVLRKYNSALRRLENFGMELLFSIPKWASYDELIKLVERCTDHLKGKDARLQRKRGRERDDYLIRLIDDKHKCAFCLKEIQQYNMDIKEISYCCEILESDVPLAWVTKRKNYSIYIDWIDFTKCNSMFCSYIQVDSLSRNIDLARQEQVTSLQTCMKLYSQAEVVEMQCEKCKEKYQNLEHLIQSMPNILVVHMKQFRYTPEGHLIKIDLRLKWQEFLDSSRYAFTSNGKLYELFSLVKHSGSSQSGHYTCIAKRKHPFQNKKAWVFFDDESGEIMKQQQNFIDDAYLLLYKKVDMPTSAFVLYSDLAH